MLLCAREEHSPGMKLRNQPSIGQPSGPKAVAGRLGPQPTSNP